MTWLGNCTRDLLRSTMWRSCSLVNPRNSWEGEKNTACFITRTCTRLIVVWFFEKIAIRRSTTWRNPSKLMHVLFKLLLTPFNVLPKLMSSSLSIVVNRREMMEIVRPVGGSVKTTHLHCKTLHYFWYLLIIRKTRQIFNLKSYQYPCSQMMSKSPIWCKNSIVNVASRREQLHLHCGILHYFWFSPITRKSRQIFILKSCQDPCNLMTSKSPIWCKILQWGWGRSRRNGTKITRNTPAEQFTTTLNSKTSSTLSYGFTPPPLMCWRGISRVPPTRANQWRGWNNDTYRAITAGNRPPSTFPEFMEETNPECFEMSCD